MLFKKKKKLKTLFGAPVKQTPAGQNTQNSYDYFNVSRKNVLGNAKISNIYIYLYIYI